MLRTTSRTIGKPGIPSREVSVNAPSEAPYEKPEKDTSLQTVETVGQLDAEVIHDLNEAVDGVLTKVVCRVVIPSKAK
uniref:Uncharacterized protein n=1 Tax=Chromera velia CCMP2878 TaxID=1169474 RepID=A0A0G4HHR4_9ALVE|eukprot:Cvel_6902.t1-p1 / transcript=Cvel_6902.t1 / gene=Cvel_6902 / organism=Chromera_velia_CCMP2878 / gene_product=hypothetical protein / transcript_product=hypothetical protein / location=Cvel_scaffold349:39617-40066(+) / protein_length=77 / sequence_SO=supercontig / SO=protein_coding / is_pseudo=false